MQIGTVKPRSIEEELRNSYMDYAMSVIISRALPDVRDGLKPVQRRILYAMDQLGLRPPSPFKKSARIVGEVLGKYHPHGDAPVYEAMVRLAQDFTMRYPLVGGQGNFGSIDDDPPAAMRYTEVRLASIAMEVLADLDKETVDFVPNFDGSLTEPTVLPSVLPNLLLNGASGIAVGMATNIAPHNLGEICDALSYLIDNPEATLDELLPLVPGPDFPTGGIIQGVGGIRNAYATGQGRITIQAKTTVEEPAKGRRAIIVTELPYQTNKAALVEKIAQLAREKKLEGIAEVRDESDRQGIRVVVELKKDTQPQLLLNNLYKHTPLRSFFAVNTLALVEGQPRPNLTLRELLQYHIDFRREVITRRSHYELRQAQERAHILEGLKTALDHLEEVIQLIRRSPHAEAARKGLEEHFHLSTLQAQAILDMPLKRLAALERQKIMEEYEEVIRKIASLEDLLANPRKRDILIQEETKAIKARHGDPRRTQIVPQELEEFREEDLIPHQTVLITLNQRGYIKRMALDSFRLQHRGGIGILGVPEGGRHILTCDSHDFVLFFTRTGRAFRLRAYDIPTEARTSRGTPLVTLLPLEAQDEVTALTTVPGFNSDQYLILATALGEVKRVKLEAFANLRSSGIIAMDLEKGDEVVSARVAPEGAEVIVVSEQGRAIRFGASGLRSASRVSGGFCSLKLEQGDRVVGMDVAVPEGHLVQLTAKGFGKLTPIKQFPLEKHFRPRRKHGFKGVLSLRVTAKTGPVVAALVAAPSQDFLLLSTRGNMSRVSQEEVSVQGRGTRGVGVMGLEVGDSPAALAPLPSKEPRS